MSGWKGFVLGVALGWLLAMATCREHAPYPAETETETETLRAVEPAAKEQKVIGYATARLPKASGRVNSLGGETAEHSRLPHLEGAKTKADEAAAGAMTLGADAPSTMARCGDGVRAKAGAMDTKLTEVVMESGDGEMVDVMVPIERKVWEGSAYRVVGRGYMMSLDTVEVRRQIVRVKERPKRWHIGVTAGIGATPRGMEPYVGVGVTYSLIGF